jgi:uncharacterized protein (TIGR03083 family)
MTTTTITVESIAPLGRDEALVLASEESRRMAELLASLDDADWARPTECPAWDVRALAGHVLGGMEDFTSFGSVRRMMRKAKRAAGDRPLTDGMTEVQVAERAHLSTAELVERLRAAAPRQAHFRHKVPGLMRRAPLKQDVGGQTETWRLGYLLDTILTRDTWMHRVDASRAVGRPMHLTAGHDGRLVADVVAEWARRHGQPCTLVLTGPAGGSYVHRDGGEAITLDAVEFCRILSGRAAGAGLLTQEVPF